LGLPLFFNRLQGVIFQKTEPFRPRYRLLSLLHRPHSPCAWGSEEKTSCLTAVQLADELLYWLNHMICYITAQALQLRHNHFSSTFFWHL
jgi:hypothetical protein